MRYAEHPEGWDVISFLKRTVAPLVIDRLVEIGAGYGRLCRAFPASAYLGLDINEEAIERAQAAHPGYQFRTVRYVDDYPPADLYLAYTVLLHIDDETVPRVIERMCAAAPVFVIGEILGRQWRHPGATPSFNREREEYEGLAQACGFVLEEEIRRPYHFYPNAYLSLLLFRRKPPPPVQLSSFPADLADPYLEFAGLYEDGWTATDLQVTLSQPPDGTLLAIRGMLPQVNAGPLSCDVAISLDGEHTTTATLAPGEFVLRVPVPIAERPRSIHLRFSVGQNLPAPDGRVIGVLLRSIGFDSD